ncbi:hypothetical protein N658DRAFT_495929 [Parathielavia hyrcaniae]|uniref:DSC E3 ubiquitin ligase complex subunit 3 n=1 Tax=Parathielavia hyrcaniae TaxID=113614 RepID=A0AAN6T2L6_9PEZI|nr:hypothetical protein N658DRAFT_495929 [Parathielavia hyrcaniae]
MNSSRAKAGGSSSSSSSSSPSSTRPSQDNGRSVPARSPSALLVPPTPVVPPLYITIRFSIAIPDLHLDIPLPQQTTVVALKHLIRGRLAADAKAEAEANDKADAPAQPTPAAQASLARLRFIHNGRILPDASVLRAVLKAPPPPPLSHDADPKGKAPVGVQPQQRVFINCSIGDVLPPSLLAEEAVAAAAPPPSPHQLPTTTTTTTTPSRTPPPRLQTTDLSPADGTHPQQPTTASAATTRPGQQHQQQRPRGFDRLLAAGFNRSEVSTLRTQFRAIHAARFTPDTLPSPDTLRAMEDAWLDNEQRLPTTTTTTDSTALLPPLPQSHPSSSFQTDDGGGGAPGMGVDEDVYGLSAATGPLIKGMLIGFVFPLGVIGWLGKEDGAWSGRMHGFVVLGVLLSVSVGLVRGLSGEE